MIYLYWGDDVSGSLAKLETTLDSLRKKNPAASVFRIDAENFSSSRLEELIVGQTLFYDKYLVMLSRLGEDTERGAELLPHLADIASSSNIFFFLEEGEENILVKELRLLAAKEIKTASEPAAVKKGFNIFTFTDAFSSGQRQATWIAFWQALRSGFSAEEVFWKLQWAIKNLLIVKVVADPKETGLSPYPLEKARRNARNFTIEELQSLHARLVDLFHEVRFGDRDLATELEKLILGA